MMGVVLALVMQNTIMLLAHNVTAAHNVTSAENTAL